MQVLFHKHVWLYTEYMPTLHWRTGASSVSPYVMTVTWWTASGIILHHRLLFRCYCYNHYKTQKYYFFYHYRYFHINLLLNTLVQILSYPGVVEFTTQLLILETILWLPLCLINKFGLTTLSSKTAVIPYSCGLSRPISTSTSNPWYSTLEILYGYTIARTASPTNACPRFYLEPTEPSRC